jgi:4-diphosphocytidyl-2C-methyl-D-erythritol kinase
LTSGESSATFILESLAQGDFVAARAHLFNRLDEVAVSLAPVVGVAKQALTEEASAPALVSGSGSAVYALFDSAGRAADTAKRLSCRGVGQVFVAQTEVLAST